MFFNDPNWYETFQQYILPLQNKAKEIKHLSFKNFGMNWGIWHHDLDQLFEGFTALESIDLSYNYIDTFIINFSRFEQLKQVNISHNALYYWGQEGSFRIDEQINAPNLEQLDLSYSICGYINIQQKAAFRHSLRWLDLSGNHFTSHSIMPEGHPPILQLPSLPALQYLALRDNFYTSVPKLRYLDSLQKLDLSGNPLRCNFQELLLLPQLQMLTLRAIGLRRIPAIFSKFTQLTQLDLSGNRISAAEIAHLQAKLPNTKVLC